MQERKEERDKYYQGMNPEFKSQVINEENRIYKEAEEEVLNECIAEGVFSPESTIESLNLVQKNQLEALVNMRINEKFNKSKAIYEDYKESERNDKLSELESKKERSM